MTSPPPAPASVRDLYERVAERRRALGLAWWEISVQADIGTDALHKLRVDVASLPTRRALEEWLRRHPAPAPASTPDT
ncbi:hypothetical protein MF672_010715 [Actinomadura sp. ATCC 31491]|uniref:XRE family transcriptional regulator n=1 Tax=Actinomadura luzonensis TaxID=2805427 RepID=A0ABT0FQR5_9ACTN|nr:hypothetical protein [Actinomadura luzonensis]MCK2214258.1 hypothetical protein [Actinomadura luzonensis]